MRLDVYAAKTWPEHSRSTWQKLIDAGHVSVNSVVQTSSKFEVADTDSIEARPMRVPDHTGDSLPIIYEDDNVIVIDKPLSKIDGPRN